MEAKHPHPVKNAMSPAAFQALFVILRMLTDAGISFGMPALAYFFYFKILSPDIPPPPHSNYILLSIIFAGVNYYFFIMFGSYRPVRGRSIIDEIFGVIKVSAISAIILLAITFYITRFSYSRMTVTYIIVFSFLLLGAGRTLLLILERNMILKGHGGKKLLIAGTGPNAHILATKILERPEIGFSLSGYLEEEPAEMLTPMHLLGNISELESVVVRNQIQEIIVALKPTHHDALAPIVDLCDRYGIECLVTPDLEQMIVGGHKYDEIAGIPVMRIKSLRMNTLSLFTKRSFDVILTCILLLLALPFFIIMAILIKLDSPGPIFYMQKRIGMDGKNFWMYKFRSMRVEAEQGGPAWSRDRDPRVTRLGAMIRKLSIDEIPQLINVLKGEMSLVGPRPERPFFVEKFKKNIPRYMERHAVKCGMTGWAQVNGLRGDTSIEERVQYDLYYIENWTLGFDVKIIILTIFDITKEIKNYFFGRKKQ